MHFKMNLVLDYVAFEGNGDAVVKEVAAVSQDGRYSCHAVVKPPYPWNSLDAQASQNYENQTCLKHGICWEEGSVPHLELGSYLKRVAGRAVAMFARGEEKCKTLEKLIGRKVIDMEQEFGAPKPDCTATVGVSCLLPCHGLPTMQCAMRDADRLRQWLDYYCKRTQIANFCCQKQPQHADKESNECACMKKV